MNSLRSQVLALALLSAAPFVARAQVEITELQDRVRVEIGGELFTEWRHSEWKAPYLYPVIGPNGENMTRHYPMREDIEGEERDHPHHRAIRFSHRKVNGFSFWAPESRAAAGEAEIVFEEVEALENGEDSGEVVIRSAWIGDGELVLTERTRLRFLPLEDRQVLMDYDIELTAGAKDVLFEDEKDGGLSVRVPETMRVELPGRVKGPGVILNSRGDRDGEAWGKAAEWADYYGPDSSGKVSGIAIFDHPSNLRYPTHWHARTYGLITANRFGKGFFEEKSGAQHGDGDYTIRAGETLKLRHRLYFHLGDTESAKVAEHFQNYLETEGGE